MISKSASKAPIVRFLECVKDICPTVGAFITDNDDAEISAIDEVFPESRHLLCWWHVLKAWRIKLGPAYTADHQFWKLLVEMLKTPNNYQEYKCKVKADASPAFLKYLETYWFPRENTWAKTYRMDVLMYKTTNTNMLIESFHNLLKTKLFSGKRNHRLDKLLYTIYGPVQDHFRRKESRNDLGLNGESIKEKCFRQETLNSATIKPDAIRSGAAMGLYLVDSISQSELVHNVNVMEETCSCFIHMNFGCCN